jgi:hypothetical protein
MVRWGELPEIALANILRSARGRSIAGTNKFARVSRQWRAASEDAEPLQLFFSPDHLSDTDLARVNSWLALHGQHVDVLVLPHTGSPLSGLCLDLDSILPALSQLTHLEVPEPHSLVQLEPVLQQLPHLQHLAATVGMDVPRKALPNCKPPPPPPGACSKFITQESSQDWWQAPDMQELCPQLTSLHLTLHSDYGDVKVDTQLSGLLSPRLQQLTLVGHSRTTCFRHWGDRSAELEVTSSSLTHLTALKQLTLEGLRLNVGGAQQLAQGLGALQQLRVYGTLGLEADLVRLAPVLTDYEGGLKPADLDVLTSCEHLTRLVLVGELPEGVADALAALTGLQELKLYADGASTVCVMQQAVGMAQLRSLQLSAYRAPSEDLACALAQCTQLTSLVLEEGGMDSGTCVSALQQLTGLRSLVLSEQLVVWEQSTWLAPLTALTRLCVTGLEHGVELEPHERRPRIGPGAGDGRLCPGKVLAGYHAKARSIGQQVQQWAPGLQHVVSCCEREIVWFAPMWCQLAPAAAGAAGVTVWLEQQEGFAVGWARPFTPCPHLPGVWELQGPVQSRSGDLPLVGAYVADWW